MQVFVVGWVEERNPSSYHRNSLIEWFRCALAASCDRAFKGPVLEFFRNLEAAEIGVRSRHVVIEAGSI